MEGGPLGLPEINVLHCTMVAFSRQVPGGGSAKSFLLREDSRSVVFTAAPPISAEAQEEGFTVPTTTTAQDRASKGPLAALLILLSLFLGSATAASGADLQGPATRLGSSRGGPSAALLPAGTRNPLDDEVPGPDAGSALPPPTAPGIVTERLSSRPGAEFTSGKPAEAARQPAASYRARAPPAA